MGVGVYDQRGAPVGDLGGGCQYRGTSSIRNPSISAFAGDLGGLRAFAGTSYDPVDTCEALCLETSGDHMGVGVPDERGAPVGDLSGVRAFARLLRGQVPALGPFQVLARREAARPADALGWRGASASELGDQHKPNPQRLLSAAHTKMQRLASANTKSQRFRVHCSGLGSGLGPLQVLARREAARAADALGWRGASALRLWT